MDASENTISREIGGRTFHVTKLPGQRSLLLMARILRVFGPALSKAIGGGVSSGQEFTTIAKARINLEKVAAGFGDLLAQLSEAEVKHVTWELLWNTTVEAESGERAKLNPSLYDVLFQGRIGDQLKLLYFGFEVQYGPFSGGLLDLARQAIPTHLHQVLSGFHRTSSTPGQPGDSSSKAEPPSTTSPTA